MDEYELNSELMLRSSLRFGTIGDDAHQFGVGAKLAIDFGFAAHPLNAWTESEGCDFKDQAVSGNDRPAKARFSDAGKQHQFLIAIFNLTQSQDGAALGQ